MEPNRDILIVDDDRQVRDVLHQIFLTAGYNCRLAQDGRDLAYTTVATLVRILCDKGFLVQTNDERPFRYKPTRSFDDVSGNLVWDLVERLFGGKREQLLVRLLEEKKLTAKERAAIEEILKK